MRDRGGRRKSLFPGSGQQAATQEIMYEADLHEAAFNGDMRELKLALQNGQDASENDYCGTTAFHKAAANGNIDILKTLADLEGHDMNRVDITGCTAIHAAARNGHLDTLKWLVEKGGDVKVKSAKGRTALDMAKSNGTSDVITYLKNADRQKFSWET